jgi:hypothetical protein
MSKASTNRRQAEERTSGLEIRNRHFRTAKYKIK